MNGAVMALIGLGFFTFGYFVYARFLARRVYRTEPGDDIVTPAHEFEDGKDFVPTNPHVLWGHHFTSIAGAAPIVGPAVAVIWGWLPAFLWVVLGTVLMGAVHDYGALAISTRNKGRTVGDLCAKAISPRVRLLFMVILVILTWVVLAVFAMIIGLLFMRYKASVLAVNFEILIALVLGWLTFKKGMRLLWPSIIALALLYLMIFVGLQVEETHPGWLTLPGFGGADSLVVSGMDAQAASEAAVPPLAGWIILLLAYAFIASVLPVWTLLQPRDFINGHQLFVGLGLIYVGIFVARPEMVAPAIRNEVPYGPPLFPLLFITIACGAISGFHGLVASGTTSKQIAHLRHARRIGYGGMLGEGTLALAAIIATTCGLASTELWHLHFYRDWEASSGAFAAIFAFTEGCSAFLAGIGLDAVHPRFPVTVVAVLVVSFAATTLDSATRIQRYILSELFESFGMRRMAGNALVCAALAAGAAAVLAFSQDKGEGGKILWPIFGASNQMIGAVTLILLTVYLARKGRPVWPVLVPMVFVGIITLAGMAGNAVKFLSPPTQVRTVVGFTLEGGAPPVIGWRPGDDRVPTLRVTEVEEGGPAAEAGLVVGDVVTRVEPVLEGESAARPGDPVFEPADLGAADAVPWAAAHLHKGDMLRVTVQPPGGEPVVRTVDLDQTTTPGKPDMFLGIVSLVIALLDVWIIAEAIHAMRDVIRHRRAGDLEAAGAGLD